MARRVIIIGAGIAGLALAQGLKKCGVPFHVFEQRSSTKDGKRRYRIRLHSDGIEALQYVLPEELWALVQLAGADIQRGPLVEMDAHTADVLVDGSAPPSPVDADSERAPAMDSEVLLELLSRGLERDITYGHKGISYEVKPSGDVAVNFSNASGALSRSDGSLVVAADGVNSTMRKQLFPDAQVLDVGGWCLSGRTPLTPELTDSLVPIALERLSLIRDCIRKESVSMLVEPMTFPYRKEAQQRGVACPPDHLHWVMAMPEEWSEQGSTMLPPRQCEQMARNVAEKWHSALRAIVEQQAPGYTGMLSLRSAAPALPVWTPRKQLTLVGDAIHAMSGATGSGAVMALRDAHQLCRAVVEGGGTAEAIGGYEADMRQYAGDAINASFLAGQLLFNQPAWEDCDIVAEE